jgi:hypothetical protein
VAHTPADGGPDRTLRELLLWALDLPAEKPPGAGPRLLDARIGGGLGRLWPSVAVGLGWADPDDADVRRLRAAPGALRAAAAQVAGEALRSRAARRPLIVLLDDAHLADEVTLDALDYAVRAEAGAPILAVALARPSFESARPSWGARAASREDVRLGPLDPGHAAALCRSLLAPAEDIPARGERRTREPRLG